MNITFEAETMIEKPEISEQSAIRQQGDKNLQKLININHNTMIKPWIRHETKTIKVSKRK
jgi:hypothetical protein